MREMMRPSSDGENHSTAACVAATALSYSLCSLAFTTYVWVILHAVTVCSLTIKGLHEGGVTEGQNVYQWGSSVSFSVIGSVV